MELKLKVLDGQHAGQDVSVVGNRFFIGRAEDCHLRPGSDLVSRHHCVLLVEEGYVGVRDLGSRNGTYVNAELLTSERELHSGDRLKVGPLEFAVVLTTGIGGKKRPAVSGGIKEAAERAATTTTTASDIDVTAWLVPEEGQAGQPSPHLSPPRIAGADTEEIVSGSTEEVVLADLAEALANTPTKAEEPKTDPKGKKPHGKLPFQPQRIIAKDSRDAASQVLEKMKKRR